MPEIILRFTPGDNEKKIPVNYTNYRFVNARIEASTLDGLKKAVQAMSIYCRFRFEPFSKEVRAYTIHFEPHVFVIAELIFDIPLDDIFIIDKNWNPTEAAVFILPDVLEPVTTIILTIECD